MNEILVNLLVSASNELGKVWEETEEQNLLPVVKIVRGTGEDSGRGSVKFEGGFLPDRFLVNLLTGRDYLSAQTTDLTRFPRSRRIQFRYIANLCKVLVTSVIC